MNRTYYLGLLLLVFGGFLSLNSTGLFGNLGFYAMIFGFLVGLTGLFVPTEVES